MKRLTVSEAQIQHKSLENHWGLRSDRIVARFEFENFEKAVDFMHEAVPCIERLNHHPDWCNRYNEITITLWTHDVGGLTDLDFALAKELSALYNIKK